MSAHTREHPTKKTWPYCRVLIEISNKEKRSLYIPVREAEKILEKYSEDEDEPIEWEVLAKDRIAKHGKKGLVLRGMRYREDLSQKDLAKKSGVTQNEISKIENGKRSVGEKVAKRLAKALNFDYKLLME